MAAAAAARAAARAVAVARQSRATFAGGGDGGAAAAAAGGGDAQTGTACSRCGQSHARVGYQKKLAHWLFLLATGWLWCKLVGITTGVPSDAVIEWDTVATFLDVQIVCGHGTFQACFVDMLSEDRYEHIFKQWKERLWFFVLFYAAGPIFGFFTFLGLDALTGEGVSAVALAVYSAVAVVLIVLVVWHLLQAWTTETRLIVERRREQFVSDEMVVDPHWARIQLRERTSFWTFVVSRSVVLGYFAVYATRIAHSSEYTLHAHHWIVRWARVSLGTTAHRI